MDTNNSSNQNDQVNNMLFERVVLSTMDKEDEVMDEDIKNLQIEEEEEDAFSPNPDTTDYNQYINELRTKMNDLQPDQQRQEALLGLELKLHALQTQKRVPGHSQNQLDMNYRKFSNLTNEVQLTTATTKCESSRVVY